MAFYAIERNPHDTGEAGWDEGVMGMQVGEVARLRCSPDYAYGAGGFPAWGIQPNSVLDFEIEVLTLH
ncbi:FKBP-type peptidyl-prolyl cis-trans isomerase domain - like 9 [Theobroma cacao]|nr:FKBP-type peptidyl-prolyl cis-trans isomerase domain - like 9 [Theobroma cacao]